MKKFPKLIYARWEEEQDNESYLIAAETDEGLGADGEKIGVYELKQVKTKRIRESLE